MTATLVLPDGVVHTPTEWRKRIEALLTGNGYVTNITPASIEVCRQSVRKTWTQISVGDFIKRHYAADCAQGIRAFALELQAEAEARNWCDTYDWVVEVINRATDYPWLLRREPPKPKETNHKWRIVYNDGSMTIVFPTQQDVRACYNPRSSRPAQLIHTWTLGEDFRMETIPW
jgi:hypothetical protein